jgi:hypothetical protein
LFGPRINAFFTTMGRGRFISYGLPLIAEGLAFALIGVVLLVLSGDKQIKALVGIFRSRRRPQPPKT